MKIHIAVKGAQLIESSQSGAQVYSFAQAMKITDAKAAEGKWAGEARNNAGTANDKSGAKKKRSVKRHTYQS